MRSLYLNSSTVRVREYPLLKHKSNNAVWDRPEHGQGRVRLSSLHYFLRHPFPEWWQTKLLLQVCFTIDTIYDVCGFTK